MTFEVKKVDYANGDRGQTYPMVEIETKIGKFAVENTVFKDFIRKGDDIVGVELKNGTKITDWNGQKSVGKITVFDMPMNSEVPRDGKDVSIFVESATVNINSADKEVNHMNIYNRNGRVSIVKDSEDFVDYKTDNEEFMIQQNFNLD